MGAAVLLLVGKDAAAAPPARTAPGAGSTCAAVFVLPAPLLYEKRAGGPGLILAPAVGPLDRLPSTIAFSLLTTSDLNLEKLSCIIFSFICKKFMRGRGGVVHSFFFTRTNYMYTKKMRAKSMVRHK